MEKRINVMPGCLARYDDASPFLLPDELDLLIRMPEVTNCEDFLVVKLNGNSATYKLEGGRVQLSGLSAGELKCEVKRTVHGELVDRISVEPLMIHNVDNGISATPELAELKEQLSAAMRRLDSQTALYNAAVQQFNLAAEKISNLEERLFALEKNYDPSIIG